VGVWGQSPQPLGASWDLEAKPPALGKFLQIFSKKKDFKHILIHIFA